MLVEIMMACLCFCGAALILANYQWHIKCNEQLARDIAWATALANDAREELLINPPKIVVSTVHIQHFTITRELTPIKEPLHVPHAMTEKFLTKIMNVTIKVSWLDSKKNEHFIEMSTVIPAVIA